MTTPAHFVRLRSGLLKCAYCPVSGYPQAWSRRQPWWGLQHGQHCEERPS